MSLLRLALLSCAPMLAAASTGIEGDWNGALNAGPVPLRIAVHIQRAADGTFSGTLDSVDQNASGIPISKIALDGRALTLEMKALGATYDAQWSADGSEITGTFHQRGMDLPFTLHRGAVPALSRPQEPKKPYPYDAEDVVYDNPTSGFKLAGTLTLPRTPGPHAAVLLITGSGPQDRDEALLGHKPFLVISDYLTRRGIAVLRVDDRGVGKSTGNFAAATTMDFATDARASVEYLKTRKEIDAKQIGLIGHSEGGVIAPMLASQSPDIAFVVMMAGTGVSGDEIIMAQQFLINRAMGMSEDAAKKSSEVERLVLDVAKQETDKDEAARKIRAGIEKIAAGLPENEKKTLTASIGAIEKEIGSLTSPWYKAFLSYDPRPALEKVKVPVLAMNGALDLQVPPHQNLPAIAAALEAGENPDYEIVKLAHLNHLFQTAKTGTPAEYAKIEETVSPDALNTMGDWILRHVTLK